MGQGFPEGPETGLVYIHLNTPSYTVLYTFILVYEGKPKQLKIRYRMKGVYGQLNLTTTLENKFPDRVLLVAPDKDTRRDLKVINATWGHPLGRSSTGRMSVEVGIILRMYA